MPKRKLTCTAYDDGTTVTVTIERYDTLGSTDIGPIPVAETHTLSFPSPEVEEWMRDMAVLFLERL